MTKRVRTAWWAFVAMLCLAGNAHADDWFFRPRPTFRGGLGPGFYLNAPTGAPDVGFEFDLMGGVYLGMAYGGSGDHYMFRYQFTVPVEIGYTFHGGGPQVGGSQFVFGTGIGIGTPIIGATYFIRGLYGNAGGPSVFGVRHGVHGSLFGILGLELAHEHRAVAPNDIDELRLMFTVDAYWIVYGLVRLSGVFR